MAKVESISNNDFNWEVESAARTLSENAQVVARMKKDKKFKAAVKVELAKVLVKKNAEALAAKKVVKEVAKKT